MPEEPISNRTGLRILARLKKITVWQIVTVGILVGGPVIAVWGFVQPFVRAQAAEVFAQYIEDYGLSRQTFDNYGNKLDDASNDLQELKEKNSALEAKQDGLSQRLGKVQGEVAEIKGQNKIVIELLMNLNKNVMQAPSLQSPPGAPQIPSFKE